MRDAVVKAGNALIAGNYLDQFPVDPYQGGAGTSTNMNVNEVMANVALELTGHKLGDYAVSTRTIPQYVAVDQRCLSHRAQGRDVTNNDLLVAEAKRLIAALPARAMSLSTC